MLYWEGQFQRTDDDTISINGNSVTGTLIGGPTTFFSRINSETFRADITALGLVGPGLNSLSVSDMAFDFANNGAGVMVILDDGSAQTIELRDGNDLVFFDFKAPLDTTVAQTFNFAATPGDRTATLDMFFSSVTGSASGSGVLRPSSIEVESGGVTTVYSNLLDSGDGGEWDTVEITANVPAGATSLTVQALSRDDFASGDLPASFAWNAAALALPVPANGAIDIEKYTKVGIDAQQGESCDRLGKPVVLTMVYTGDGPDGSSNSQDPSKATVTGDPNDAASVRIIALDKSDPNDNKAKIWFDGTVALDGSFDIDAAAEDKDRLSSNTFVLVFDLSDNLLQEVQFHTSCSQPLALGDQFGSALLTGWIGQN